MTYHAGMTAFTKVHKSLVDNFHRLAAFFIVFAGFFLILFASNKIHKFSDASNISKAHADAPSCGHDTSCGSDGSGGK